MLTYYVFDTKTAATKAQQEDIDAILSSLRAKAVQKDIDLGGGDKYLKKHEKYALVTKSAGDVRKTVNGKWVYEKCKFSTADHKTVDLTPDMFPE